MPSPIDFSSIGGRPVGPTSPSTTPSIDFSSIGGKRIGAEPATSTSSDTTTATPSPPTDTGVLAGLGRVAEGIISLPANLWHAFMDPAKDDNEALQAELLKDHLVIPSQHLALGFKRLIADPMLAEADKAKQLRELAKKQSPEQAQNFYSGTEHMANMHDIASMVPLLGPLAGSIVERYLGGDKSGAATELFGNITAGALLDRAAKGAARKVEKIAPRETTIAGEKVPVMAGQEKDAAPIAKKVAAEPSPAIADAQQTAAQQAVKNIAGDAATTQLDKMSPGATTTASTFEDAAAQARAAAKPTFEKLDQLSNGEFSTLQNTIKTAREASRRATTIDDANVATSALKNAQQSVQDLMTKHGSQFQPDELTNAQSVWKDSQVLDDVHSFVEKAFSAPENVAAKSNLVSRTLDGNKLLGNLNRMVDQVPAADLNRVLGPDGVSNLYELSQITSKPEQAAAAGNIVEQVAQKLIKGGVGAKVGSMVAGPQGAAVGAAADTARNMVLRYLATSPRVSHLVITALKVGTPPKIYAPLIANAINTAQNE